MSNEQLAKWCIYITRNARHLKKPIYENGQYTKSITYIECPNAFDIETSSFMLDGEKMATMYIWQFGINGASIVGRTWEQFDRFCTILAQSLELSTDNRLVVYVHNLNYEFQWIRKRFQWEKVFSLDSRKPVQAVTTNGIEFRCSYILSGYSLEKVGEHLTKYKVSKKVGQLDYNLLRHTETPISDAELEYCVDDIRVVMSYIKEEIERNGSILNIPLTKTGYVRRDCRNACFYGDGKKNNQKRKFKYMDFMKRLTLEPDEFLQLQRAFQGGFCHANPMYADVLMENVGSDDETSAYPTVMVAEKFPCTKAEKITPTTDAEFYKWLECYCCLFDIEFTNLRPTIWFENYISRSRCWAITNPRVANGRVVSADMLRTTITEIDFKIIRKCYKWDSFKVYNFRRYRKGYLPTDFVKAILTYYGDKTKLKGIDGKEVEYLHAKENVNSCYGMMVTNPLRPDYTYTDQWNEPTEPDVISGIEKYNADKNRFLFFPWGCWVTAYARRNLWNGIFEYGADYVYSDTDSVKGLHRERHLSFFDDYNKWIIEKLETAMDYHKLPREMICPQTIKGEPKPLGVWDYEGTYTRFKTLGAKRYLTEKDGDLSLTVSGVNKKSSIPYLLKRYGKDTAFEKFTTGLVIPPEYSGKLTHTYIDEPTSGIITDYIGNTIEFSEMSSIHLAPSEYHLSIAEDFIEFLKGLQYG